DQDDGDVFLVRLRLQHFGEAVALDARQVDVQEDDVGGVAGQDVVELDPARGGEHGASLALEQRAAELQHQRVVIENQDSDFRQRYRHAKVLPPLRVGGE